MAHLIFCEWFRTVLGYKPSDHLKQGWTCNSSTEPQNFHVLFFFFGHSVKVIHFNSFIKKLPLRKPTKLKYSLFCQLSSLIIMLAEYGINQWTVKNSGGLKALKKFVEYTTRTGRYGLGSTMLLSHLKCLWMVKLANVYDSPTHQQIIWWVGHVCQLKPFIYVQEETLESDKFSV